MKQRPLSCLAKSSDYFLLHTRRNRGRLLTLPVPSKSVLRHYSAAYYLQLGVQYEAQEVLRKPWQHTHHWPRRDFCVFCALLRGNLLGGKLYGSAHDTLYSHSRDYTNRSAYYEHAPVHIASMLVRRRGSSLDRGVRGATIALLVHLRRGSSKWHRIDRALQHRWTSTNSWIYSYNPFSYPGLIHNACCRLNWHRVDLWLRNFANFQAHAIPVSISYYWDFPDDSPRVYLLLCRHFNRNLGHWNVRHYIFASFCHHLSALHLVQLVSPGKGHHIGYLRISRQKCWSGCLLIRWNFPLYEHTRILELLIYHCSADHYRCWSNNWRNCDFLCVHSKRRQSNSRSCFSSSMAAWLEVR